MKIKKDEEVESKKQDIILIAKEIIVEQGIENLSIRKIALKLNQSPGIIYHYFKDKNEIIRKIVESGYEEIVKVILSNQSNDTEKCIYDTFKGYIYHMLNHFFLFETIMNTNDPQIKDRVNILIEGISESRSSIQMLCRILQKGMEENIFIIKNIELRAQTMWCATYGLIQRIAKEIPVNREDIIEEHLQMLVQSLKG